MKLLNRPGSNRPSSGHQLYDQNDDRDHQKYVDQVADRCAGKAESQSPEHQKDNNNRPKHSFSPLFDKLNSSSNCCLPHLRSSRHSNAVESFTCPRILVQHPRRAFFFNEASSVRFRYNSLPSAISYGKRRAELLMSASQRRRLVSKPRKRPGNRSTCDRRSFVYGSRFCIFAVKMFS